VLPLVQQRKVTMSINWTGTWRGKSPEGDNHRRAREVVKPTGTIMRGKIPSRKNGRMIDHEGLLERDAIFLFEASFRIKKYREQPITIHYPDGNKLRRYTPDFELVLDIGEIILVEIKHSESLVDRALVHKLDCIERCLRQSGKTFIVLTEKLIRLEPRLTNLRQICAETKRIWPTLETINHVINKYKRYFPTTLQHANELLVQHDLNVQTLFVLGALTIDLSESITSKTLVDITKEDDNAYFWIAQKYGF
jgi:hypothetical protein